MSTTISRGVRAPIIRKGDDIVAIAVDSVLAAAKQEGFSINEKDVVCVTESVVARADGNFASVDDIAADVRAKFPSGHVGVVFPIQSRNRFAICLKGIARGAKKVTVQFSYPSDEVGNHLIDLDTLDASGVDPWRDVLSIDEFHKHFGKPCHPFTGMDYVQYYTDIIEGEGAEAEMIFANSAAAIVNYTKDVLAADIHTRERTARLIKNAGGENVYKMSDILSAPVNGSGYNPEYGLLGSNRATDDDIKLFPKNAQQVAEGIQKLMLERTGVKVEAMVYGDGAFKDPVGKIWELADPVVSPGYTDGLNGLPNELKLKYLADNDLTGGDFIAGADSADADVLAAHVLNGLDAAVLADNDLKHLSGKELEDAVREAIRKKSREDNKRVMASMGTTPRRLTDLIGSLCDLTSGSGDKGTPIILVQGYFNNYAD